MSSIQVIRTQEGAESWDSAGNVKQYEIKYFVLGPASKQDAKDAIFSDSPEAYEGLDRSGVKFDGFDEDGNVEFTVIYEKKSTSSTSTQNEPVISFDCGTGTRHVTTATDQKKLWQKAGATVKNAGKFVGWNGKTGPDSVISGADVPFAQPRETYTKKMSLSQLSTAFRRKMAGMVGCINSAKWKGWEKGEVMFLGCSYSGSASEDITVTFNFAIQMNESLVIAEGVPSITKPGHEYVWTMSETKYDAANKAPQIEVTAVYSALLTRYADFSTLGL